MQRELAVALLRSIVEAEAAFMEAAEALNVGAIGQPAYQRAADRFHGSIDRAADCLEDDAEIILEGLTADCR